MDEYEIQTTIDFARLIMVEDPDLLDSDIYKAPARKSVNEIEAYLIESRKRDNDRDGIDSWELHLVIVMLLDGASDADIRERIANIREKYPITVP